MISRTLSVPSGAGGVGETSVALAVLHHDRIKERFGESRRFIRCDKFQLPRPISFANSPTLSVLDREPRGPGFPPIIDIFEGNGEGAESVQQRLPLCHLQHSHCPPHCKRLEIPTLQVEAVCNVFYCTYGDVDRSGTVDDLLQRLDFHALSITLLTTTASSNIWNHD